MSHRVLFMLCAALPVLGCKSGSDFAPPPPSDLPAMTSVNASVREDNVSVTFDPVDGAKDYRIYEIPASGDAGTTNVVYRCAGDRESFPVALDGEADPSSAFAVHTRVNSAVLGFNRTTADATLGYVWTTAGDGRVPVYSLGDPNASGDNACFFARYDESRVKKFTTDANERATLISQGWRDMGIAFYAAAPGTAGTTQIDLAQTGATNTDRLYFTDASAEKAARGSFTVAPAFSVLAAQAAGTAPLMRVFYQNSCGHNHDELVAGQAKFAKAEHQGPQPATTLTWTGLKGPTTLAIEALSSGCPYQGLMSAQAIPAGTFNGVAHQAFVTPDQMQAADPNHNLYVNGQHDGVGAPVPIARSFVQVNPGAAESWDFREGFDTDPIKDLVQQPGNLFETNHFLSSKYEMSYINVESKTLFSAGVINGELSLTYADSGADRTGKFRLTPLQKANLAAGSYVHATMEVDAFSTERRYPQILISTADAPVQTINVAPNLDNMTNASTLVVQAFDSWPTRVDIQACINRTWDVNGQCPRYKSDWATDFSTQAQPPAPVIGELETGDKRVRFDVWASTSKVYFMIDGKPAACASLTAAHTMPSGPVTVTYGDVLYHSGVDISFGSNPANPYPGFPFHEKHQQFETHRHFDELAFKSGEAAPQWDETLVPCATSHDCGTCTDGSCSTCVQ
jgi:hypothetical protein